MFKFDLETLSWYHEIPLEDSLIPYGMKSHSAVVYKNEMYIFGGTSSDNSLLNDKLYSYNFGNFSKTWLNFTRNS